MSPNEIHPAEPCLLSAQEKAEFEKTYDHVLRSLVKLNDATFRSSMKQETKWMKTVFEYNVRPKDHLSCRSIHMTFWSRGHIVPLAYKTLLSSPVPEQTHEGVRLDFILGWLVESFCGSYVMMSDIVDEKNFMHHSNAQGHYDRNGYKTSWHQLRNVGMTAINDGFMLRVVAHNVFKIYFVDHPSRYALENLFRDSNHKCLIGRMLREHMKKEKDVSTSFTMERYRLVVKHEISHHAFYLPVTFALALAGKNDDLELLRSIKDIMFEIGYYHQLREEYFEIFQKKNESFPLKLQKLSWFFVRAMEKYRQQESYAEINRLVNLVETNDVSNVQTIYQEIGLVQEYHKEREAQLKKIMRTMEEFPETVKSQLSQEFFNKLIEFV